jgi:hypothetical protein
MARPDSTKDIEIAKVDFGTLNLDMIALDPALLKGYTAFIEAVVKAGAVMSKGYGGTSFSRHPSQVEMQAQLKDAQDRWDEGFKQYNILATVGEVEYPYLRDIARRWAESEDLPFPPKVEESLPIPSVEDTIASIDEVIA